MNGGRQDGHLNRSVVVCFLPLSCKSPLPSASSKRAAGHLNPRRRQPMIIGPVARKAIGHHRLVFPISSFQFPAGSSSSFGSSGGLQLALCVLLLPLFSFFAQCNRLLCFRRHGQMCRGQWLAGLLNFATNSEAAAARSLSAISKHQTPPARGILMMLPMARSLRRMGKF